MLHIRKFYPNQCESFPKLLLAIKYLVKRYEKLLVFEHFFIQKNLSFIQFNLVETAFLVNELQECMVKPSQCLKRMLL